MRVKIQNKDMDLKISYLFLLKVIFYLKLFFTLNHIIKLFYQTQLSYLIT